MEQEEVKKTSERMEAAEKKTSSKIEKTAAQKVAEVAEKMAANPRQKVSPKDAILTAVRAQKSQFKKALKNGYTRKEILANLKEQGIVISARDLAAVLGTKKSKSGA